MVRMRVGVRVGVRVRLGLRCGESEGGVGGEGEEMM